MKFGLFSKEEEEPECKTFSATPTPKTKIPWVKLMITGLEATVGVTYAVDCWKTTPYHLVPLITSAWAANRVYHLLKILGKEHILTDGLRTLMNPIVLGNVFYAIVLLRWYVNRRLRRAGLALYQVEMLLPVMMSQESLRYCINSGLIQSGALECILYDIIFPHHIPSCYGH